MKDSHDRFSIRKYSVGVVSVLVGSFIFGLQSGSQTVKADTTENNQQVTAKLPEGEAQDTISPTVTLTNQSNSAQSNNSEEKGAATSTQGQASQMTTDSASSGNPAASLASFAAAAPAANNSVNATSNGAAQAEQPAPADGYSVIAPTGNYRSGYNENNVPLDPNTDHTTVISYIVTGDMDNDPDSAKAARGNRYAYSVSQADVNGTGEPSQIYVMKFDANNVLVKTVKVPISGTGSNIYTIDNYAEVIVSRGANQDVTISLQKIADDQNWFTPIYSIIPNVVTQTGANAQKLRVPNWVSQKTTYTDEDGNEIRPPYYQYGWGNSSFTTEPVMIPGYDVRATPDYVPGQYDENIPASQKNGTIAKGTNFKVGDHVNTETTTRRGTMYVQRTIIDDQGTVRLQAWFTYAKEAGTFDTSVQNDVGRVAAVLPSPDYDFATNPNGYKIYTNISNAEDDPDNEDARAANGLKGEVAFNPVRFVYTNPADHDALGNNGAKNAPSNDAYNDPAQSVDYTILPYETNTYGTYDHNRTFTFANTVKKPSEVNYVYWTQKATIKYINDTTGETLQTDEINGRINSTSEYSPFSTEHSGSSTIGYDNPRTTKTIADFEKEGYVLVSNNYPIGGAVFNTPNNPQTFEIHFVEGAVPITPDTPSSEVPTGTPDNAQPSALKKDVTLNVKYVNEDGTTFTGTAPANANQSVSFTGKAYVSKVTGKLVNAKQDASGQWIVDKDSTATPEITWSPENGSFNEVVSPVEQGYYLKSISSHQAGNNIGAISGITHESNDVEVTVTYAKLGKIIPVDPEGNEIPGVDHPQFPNNPDDPSKGNPGDKPDVPGWTPQDPSKTVTPDPSDPGKDVKVPYEQNKGTITVTVHDDTDNVDLPQYGKSSGEQTVGTDFTYDKTTIFQDLENKGYKIVNPGVVIPTEITEGNQNIVINVVHKTTTIDPNNPGTPDRPINPNDLNGPKWPAGTDKDSLEKAGSQTVHYVYSDGTKAADDNVQDTTFAHTLVFDNVTGKQIEDKGWSPASYTFKNVASPTINGYTPDKAVVNGATVTADNPTSETTVTYTKDAPATYNGSQTIKYVDGNGKEIHTPNVQTATDLTGDHTFRTVNNPVIPGYTTTEKTAGGSTVTKDNPNSDITVVYTPNGKVIPVDPDGNPISGVDQPQFPTNQNDPTTTTPGEKPKVPGYHPATGQPGDPVDPVPGKPGEDVKVPYVADTPVTPENPETPVTPGNPATPGTPVRPTDNGDVSNEGNAEKPFNGPQATKQEQQLPQTGNEQSVNKGVFGLLALGLAALLPFGKRGRKE